MLTAIIAESRTEFATAATSYEAALNGWRTTIDALRQAQGDLRAADFDRETREAELLLNLEVPERSNAEQRAALLQQACAGDEEWLRLCVVVEEARNDVATRTDAAQGARDRMSLEKRRMDFTLAWLRLLAADGGEDK